VRPDNTAEAALRSGPVPDKSISRGLRGVAVWSESQRRCRTHALSLNLGSAHYGIGSRVQDAPPQRRAQDPGVGASAGAAVARRCAGCSTAEVLTFGAVDLR
jgi:hypothetical protein